MSKVYSVDFCIKNLLECYPSLASKISDCYLNSDMESLSELILEFEVPGMRDL